MKKKLFTFLVLFMVAAFALSLIACKPNDDFQDDSNDNTPNKPVYPPEIKNPERYSEIILEKSKLENALNEALKKIDYAIPTFTDKFPDHASVNNVYAPVDNVKGWNEGFWTGILWHAYELTGNEKYKTVCEGLLPSFTTRIDEKLGTESHDMGFLYSPSCVAAWKITNDADARLTALKAADNLKSRYHSKGKFIQAWGKMGNTKNHRLIIDCLMNIPLLYWASEETGDNSYKEVAYNHLMTTLNVCYRDDGSTIHTYFFDPETGKPLYGKTHQGYSDDSAWSRGQAWGIYGPMLSYKYEKNDAALSHFKMAANYFLNNLPEDNVPYWDFTFKNGSKEPRDSSAAAIAVCGLLEGIKHMEETDPLREIYFNAAKHMMNSLIESYTTKDLPKSNGLLLHATYARKSDNGVDEMNIWGDYFYMEALHRFLDPEFETYF